MCCETWSPVPHHHVGLLLPNTTTSLGRLQNKKTFFLFTSRHEKNQIQNFESLKNITFRVFVSIVEKICKCVAPFVPYISRLFLTSRIEKG